MMKYGIHRVRIPREAYSYKLFSANPVRIAGRDGLTFLSQKAMDAVKRLHFYDDGFLLGHGRWRQHERRKPEYLIDRLPFGVHEIMMHSGTHWYSRSQPELFLGVSLAG